jgi:hypothetical protein
MNQIGNILWIRYRRLRVAVALLLLTWPIPVGLTAYFLAYFGYSAAPAILLFVLWMGAYLYLSFKLAFFKCPRCGGRFRRYFSSASCRNCGLRVNEQVPDANSPGSRSDPPQVRRLEDGSPGAPGSRRLLALTWVTV